MRELYDHKFDGEKLRVTGAPNDRITIEVTDEPGHGGANHIYEVGLGPSIDGQLRDSYFFEFQNGSIKENGVNGITHEVLLAILIDRMRGFQAGAYACRENAMALTKMEEALMWLHKRTKDREVRGVEGTHEV